MEVGAIRYADFLVLLDAKPHIGRSLVIALSERLRAANALIAATTSQDIRARLASLLLNLSTQFGEIVDNGTRISLRLTNQEMANMIATTRETVNRTLAPRTSSSPTPIGCARSFLKLSAPDQGSARGLIESDIF